MNRDVTGIVLAGGRSTRFGADKLAVRIGSVTVVDRAIAAVSTLASDVILVGSSPSAAPARHMDDPEPFGGPLQALAGALVAVETPIALVVAGDMPSMVPSVLALLLEHLAASDDLDAVLLTDPHDPSRRQPIPLAIRVEAARAAAAAALVAGDRSLVRLLGRVRTHEVPVNRWLPLDPEALTLVDIDVPDDLRRARDAGPDQEKR